MRELLVMTECRQREAWAHTSAVMALMVNIHRDPKKQRALRLDHFNALARKARRSSDTALEVPADVFISTLAKAWGINRGQSGGGGVGGRTTGRVQAETRPHRGPRRKRTP